MTRYRLDYSSDAVDDLLKIHAFIEQYAGPDVADRKLADIEAATYRLAHFPKVGTARDEFHPGLRVVPLTDKAIICFIVDDESMTLSILCFGYAGSDWSARLKDRL